MGYRSDIRIATTKRGFNFLKEYVYMQSQKIVNKESDYDYNLLNHLDIKKVSDNQVYFGWNDLKWYEGTYEDVDIIINGLNELSNNDYSYRYARMGEQYDDYEESCFDGDRDNDTILDYPCLSRYFDDDMFLDSGEEI